MDSQNHLDVTITKLKTRFKATCTLFPECKGVGESEEKALLNLSHSISAFIANLTQKSIETLFQSNNFESVFLDSTAAKKKQTKRFKLDPALSHLNNHFVLKYKTNVKPPKAEPLPENDIVQFFRDMESTVLEQLPKEIGGGTEVLPDGLVFGFPLNMN